MAQAMWLIGLPIGAATVVYLMRRMWAGAVLAALVAFLLAGLVVQTAPGQALNLLGRTIKLDQLSQVTLFLLFMATAALFLVLIFLSLSRVNNRGDLSYWLSSSQEWRVFYPAALLILGLFGAASLSNHVGITAIFIELAAIIMVFVIQTERLESTRASLRFLTLTALATPLFLLAAWKIDAHQLSGGVISLPNLEQIALLLGIGFAIWLAVWPFHSWLTSTAAEASPPTAAFVLITFPLIVVTTLIHVLTNFPWLVSSLYLVNAIILAGLVTALGGGVLASMQRGFSELMGYAALYDLGCIVTVLGLGGQSAIITILVSLTIRTLALILMAVSLSTLNLDTVSSGFAQVKGMAYRMPAAATGVIIAGLTLAGVPFLAGFAPHWQLVDSMTAVNPGGAMLLVAGGLGVSIGYLRGLRAMLTTEPEARGRRRNYGVSFTEPYPLMGFMVALIAACLLLGLFPELLIEPLRLFSRSIGFPIP
jgi:formate hydrogenlyase subunit 3/multisubunit Na+/H+ antiporter MnhD subunit